MSSFDKAHVKMERIILYFLGWTVIVIVILIFVPPVKIRAIGGFFREVLPRLPISAIIKLFRK